MHDKKYKMNYFTGNRDCLHRAIEMTWSRNSHYSNIIISNGKALASNVYSDLVSAISGNNH